MNVKDSTGQSQSKRESENSQGVTLFSLLISISIGAFTLLKSFLDNVVALVATGIFIVIFIVLIRLASSNGILRAIGRWLSGN